MKAFQLENIVVVIATIMVVSVTLYGADIQAGTWKLDVAKSRYSPGPAPKSQITTIQEVEGGIKLVTERTDANGKVARIEYSVKYDGNDYPVMNDPSRDTVASRMIDAHTIETISKKNGKATVTLRIVYARDGKSRTEAIFGTDPQGNKVDNMTYWVKQ